MKYKKLTKRQLDIMKILWASDKPMLTSDISKRDSSLNSNTVQATIRALLKYGYIEVADIVYSGTVLSRSYIPVISADEYIEDTFSDISKDILCSSMVSNYIEQEDDISVINRLETMLQKRKDELERK